MGLCGRNHFDDEFDSFRGRGRHFSALLTIHIPVGSIKCTVVCLGGLWYKLEWSGQNMISIKNELVQSNAFRALLYFYKSNGS